MQQQGHEQFASLTGTDVDLEFQLSGAHRPVAHDVLVRRLSASRSIHPGHLAIAEGRPLLKPLGLYHGKPGKGLSIEMKVKHGPVTLLSVVETGYGRLKLLVAEGLSVPGPILQIGNTNSRYKFPLDIKTFVNNWCKEGPAHHCAIGVGHIADKIDKLGHILGIATVKVC